MKIATISRGTGNNIVEFFSEIILFRNIKSLSYLDLAFVEILVDIGIFGRIHWWYVWLKKKKIIKAYCSYDTDWMEPDDMEPDDI